MDWLKEFIYSHAPIAHWYLLGAILLAGFSIPISADVLVLLAALLAATIIPEHTVWLFSTLLVGCYVSAMIAYWMGRLLGSALQNKSWFNKLAPPQRRNTIQAYYSRYGLLVLLIGRFIPFGVRNCIFMSSGMSRMSFKKFLLADAIACTLWYSLLFSAFFSLGKNFEILISYLKTFNLLILSAFAVTLIGFIWYKRKKRKASSQKA